MNHNIKLIVVDYLQLLKGPQQRGSQVNRQQEVASISRLLKQVARQSSVPVIAVAQLSRKIEERMGASRSNPEPILSDLRESGAIEQDADLVTFIHYETVADDEGGNNNNESNDVMVEYIIAKHRNGRTGRARLQFVKNYSKFIYVKGINFNPNEKKPQN
jgi:replicative DNA helicase